MATTNFVSGTVVESSWLNDVDDGIYRKLAETVSIGDFSSVAAAVAAAVAADTMVAVYQSLTVNIPSDVATLQVAIDRIKPTAPNVVVTLNIETGHTIASQLLLVGKDARQFRVVAEDAVVTIQRSALTTSFIDRYPAFGADKQATMPVFDCLFNMDSSGTASLRDAFFIYGGSSIYLDFGAGCTNAGDRGLHVTNNSFAYARQSVFTGCTGRAVRVANGSYACIRDSNLQNCAAEAIATGSAFVDALGCNTSGSLVGLQAYDSQVRFEQAFANNCGTGIQAYSSSVSARNTEIDGCTTYGVLAREGSNVNLRSALIRNTTGTAIFASNSVVSAPSTNCNAATVNAIHAIASRVTAPESTLTNAGAHGVLAEDGSVVAARSSDSSTAGTFGYMINQGSTIDANDATGTRGRTINSLSRHGIIYST
jgi:hypothetical protein